MPVAVSYPGVYVQPLITQAPTDQGVATSITAFVGRTFMGPTNMATTITCFSDFERTFGGLTADYPLSYAVNDFYNNGGGLAIIVRLYAPYFSSPSVEGQATLLVEDLKVAVGKVTTVADAQKALTTEIGKLPGKNFNDYQIGLANQIQAAFQQMPTTLTGQDLTDAENAAYGMVVRQTAASMTINIVNTVQSAAYSLYMAALAAAAGSPDDTGVVTTAIARAASAYAATNPPPVAATTISATKTAVLAMVGKAVSPGGGSWLALQVAASAPGAAETALGLTTNAAYKTIDADFKSGLDVAKAGGAAAVLGGATGQTVFAAISNKAKGATTAGPAIVAAAAQATLAGGGNAYAVAAAAYLATFTVISNDWPTTLTLNAADQGSWGNSLAASVDYNGQVAGSGLFNLTIQYVTPTGVTMMEQFRSVSTDATKPNANRLDVVLATQSNYVRVPTDSSGNPILTSASGGPLIPDAQGTGNGIGGTDSNPLQITDYLGDPLLKTGLYALEQVPIFNIMVIPPDQAGGDTPLYVYQIAADYCAQRLAMLIMDPPGSWYSQYQQGQVGNIQIGSLGSFSAVAARSATVYFPRMIAVDPLQNGQQAVFPASGAIAGIWAATDISRGVWKAPAGLAAGINGVVGLQANLTNAENGLLNPQGINCLRTFTTGGTVVWGARTVQGADALEDEYKYVPVQRTLLYISASLLANTQWAVFEPNDEPLWAELRLSVGVFMAGMFRQGAFQGQSADQAYFVKCDSTTTTQADIDAGIVNIQVGFAPLKPAEFVIITIQQITQQSS